MEDRDFRLNICYNCMRKLDTAAHICPSCGYNNDVCSNPENVLPEGTILFRKYLVGRMIGRGGFGVTYVGYDLDLQLKVAIKEYFPAGVSMRSSKSYDVVSDVSTSQDHTAFSKGCEAFLDEARMLASVESPNIVHVRDFFREHGTAYIVMNYVEGMTLPKVMMQNNGRIDAGRIIRLALPLIEQLDELHEMNIIHRDIKPDNIMVVNDRRGERLVLLDFGAARSFVSGNVSKTFTAVVTPGFAPPEQYSQRSKQGAYTDVYGLCATMYYAITGVIPPTATERSIEDVPIKPFRSFGLAVPRNIEDAIMHGLALRSTDRTQTMRELYEELATGAESNRIIPKNNRNTMEEYAPRHTEQRRLSPVQQDTSGRKKRKKQKSWVKVFLFSLLILCVAGLGILLFGERKDSQNLSTILTTESPKPTTLDVTPEPTQPPEATPPMHIIMDNIKVDDYITFGSYEQDNDLTNGKEPIEWIVLAKEKDRALLLSRYALDAQPYSSALGRVSWESCTLRSWLNNSFFNEAFSRKEQNEIIEATVSADNNPKFSVDPGNATLDRVFLLSIEEINKYIGENFKRSCEGTEYCYAVGAEKHNANGNCWWWLRTPGMSNNNITGVNSIGEIQYLGTKANLMNRAVRPAIWVALGQETNPDSENGDSIAAQIESLSNKENTITFGTYEQDNNFSNGPEPIEWLVLKQDGNNALLLSKYALDCRNYNEIRAGITWKACTLRAWLNGSFLITAFTAEDQNRIQTTHNPKKPTLDKVFLLSVSEAEQLFASDVAADPARQCKPTEYTRAQNCFEDSDSGGCRWWLRTPGKYSYRAAYVNCDGSISSIGDCVEYDFFSVRPAIWVNIA